MSATIAEKLGSGELQGGDTGQHEKLYLIQNETSEISALSLLGTTAPDSFSGLIRQTCRVSPVDGVNDIWIGEVEYVDPEDAEPAEGTTTFSFNTSGGSQHSGPASFMPAQRPNKHDFIATPRMIPKLSQGTIIICPVHRCIRPLPLSV
jgi:hypothetical protein